jgi:hypothetical protein
MLSFSVNEKMRCKSDREPKGWAMKRSRTPDMTAAGLAMRITFFISVYGTRPWILFACANSSGELSSARNRWYIVAATLFNVSRAGHSENPKTYSMRSHSANF